MYIAHNILAMNAQRQYKISDGKIRKSTEKLSSGYRINRAADDAAGLSISEKMRKQIRGLDRASTNCEDGVSLVQVADGALNETHSILQRMNELAVQSANGTNSAADRAAIEDEKRSLVSELNRIANTTTFNNDIYPLCGKNGTTDIPMKTITYEDISMDDVKLMGSTSLSQKAADTYVGQHPFSNSRKFDSLNLQAVIDDKNNEFPIDTYNLLFNNGGTGMSKMRISNATDVVTQVNPPEQYEVNLNGNDVSWDGTYDYDAAAQKWSRTFNWTSPNGDMKIKIVQSVQIDDANKNYIISNSVSSEGTTPAFFEFMVNMDTAYNNDDHCEGYYVDKTELTKNSIYNSPDDNDLFEEWLDTSMSPYIYDDSRYPDSISIVNRNFEDVLPFTEKISFASSPQKPVISIGKYNTSSTGSASWDYFNSTGTSNGLGDDAVGTDRTMTLIWSTGNTASSLSAANSHSQYEFSFTYGVDSVKTDSNIPDTATKKYKTIQVPDLDAMDDDSEPDILRIWAGDSSAVENGIYMHLVDATAETLGVGDIDLSTEDSATTAIDAISDAIAKASSYRSYFGAMQNRMEHTIANLDNVVENTTSAESRIRDTDMAEEMVNYSKSSIIAQASQSMLVQANQSTQGVLSLLQ